MLKGFALDDERLKQGKALLGKDYFEELLERIREIRASERRFYQKITDIYATAADYDPKAPLTQHAGLVFRVRIDDEAVARSLEEKEFKTSDRGHPATSSLVSLAALAQAQLEPWSGKVLAENWLSPPQ